MFRTRAFSFTVMALVADAYHGCVHDQLTQTTVSHEVHYAVHPFHETAAHWRTESTGAAAEVYAASEFLRVRQAWACSNRLSDFSRAATHAHTAAVQPRGRFGFGTSEDTALHLKDSSFWPNSSPAPPPETLTRRINDIPTGAHSMLRVTIDKSGKRGVEGRGRPMRW